MSDTRIEWADRVWNPVTGCSKVSSGCANCYAERMSKRLAGRCGYPADDPFKVTVHHDKLSEPLKWNKPQRIFVNSMSDLFHDDVPEDYLDQVFSVMAKAKQHTFMVLTKRPARMLSYMQSCQRGSDDVGGMFPWLNVWLGVSAENQQSADERIPLLLKTPAAVRFVSCEPLIGPVNIRGYLMAGINPGLCNSCGEGHDFMRCPNYGRISKSHQRRDGGMCTNFQRKHFAIDWVIVGGETGPGARPVHPDWVRGLRDQCQASGVPCFFKGWGDWKPFERDYSDMTAKHLIRERGEMTWQRIGKKHTGRELDGRTWDEFPEVAHV